ncbi:MAG: hypothetical protein ABGZ17_02565, partial [Planctomycetaceae bacterium]
FEFLGTGLEVRTASSQEDTQEKETVANRSAREFSDQFTRHLDEMAAEIPVFGELQNLVALAVAAQLIVDRGGAMDRCVNLRPLCDDEVFGPVKCRVPQWVGSLAGSRMVRGKHWLISISGGVDFDPRKIVEPANWKQERAGVLGQQLKSQQPTGKQVWWWD